MTGCNGENGSFPYTKANNTILTDNSLTLGHLRIYLQMKFVSLREAGRQAGLSYARIRQLVTAKYLPSKPSLVKRISEAWDIDPIKLTQLFERYREADEKLKEIREAKADG